MKELEELIVCACQMPEHQIILRTIEGDEDVYVTIHLVKLPFFKRLLHGIKYIFGYTSKYGDFDEIVISRENVGKLKKAVKWLNTNHNPIK